MGTAGVVGVVLVVGLVLLILKWVLTTVAILAVPFGIWWTCDRLARSRRLRAAEQQALSAQRRRAEVEALASVDAFGGCGWCGSRLAHVDRRGRMVMPRDWHRAEIEAVVSRAPAAAR
ncbi:hypothetical protein BJF78_28260 [Pseudonocardia sp. CNS-139]|nr:hypothetical protein BJF78_28260 [Pseudonocardia sp. CNS-139]